MLPEAPQITYQEERVADVWADLQALLTAHWKEIALYQDRMPLDVDYETYVALEARQQLFVLTVRVDEELAGYFVAFIHPHLHYRRTLVAQSDVYYIKPLFRTGWFPFGLFREAERRLKARGVQVLTINTKLKADVGVLLRRLGLTPVESLYSKWIGE